MIFTGIECIQICQLLSCRSETTPGLTGSQTYDHHSPQKRRGLPPIPATPEHEFVQRWGRGLVEHHRQGKRDRPRRRIREVAEHKSGWRNSSILDRFCSSSLLTSSAKLGSEGQLSEFIDGLGPGQLVGRQVLASPSLGDIQLSMRDRSKRLEIEVIRARGLNSKPGSKTLPAPWVKVYLVSGKRCLAKAKTTTARRTLDPLYQQQLVFQEAYNGCVLQVRELCIKLTCLNLLAFAQKISITVECSYPLVS